MNPVEPIEERRIHMVGIGGSGMSSLALFLKERGARVTGEDRIQSPVLARLERRGIPVYLEEGGNGALPPETELVVHSAAVGPDHPRVADARGRGIPVRKYAQALGAVMDRYRGIAVAGSHGKTTVSALCAFLLRACGRDPSFVIGGVIPDLAGGGGAGRGEWFVAEACEYDRSFLNLNPEIAVVTNVEPDHLDYYGDFEHLKEAFRRFVARAAARRGTVVVEEGTAGLFRDAESSGLTVRTYGFGPAADLVIHPEPVEAGGAACRLSYRTEDLGRFHLDLPGRHNMLNGAAAFMVGLALDLPPTRMVEALSRFRGVKRRLEERGCRGGVRIFSDYAHHPTEIRAVAEALRERFPGTRLVAAYQGHQDWRTAYFLEEMAEALSRFDEVLVLETFSVREERPDASAGAETLVAAVRRSGGDASFAGGLRQAPREITARVAEGDLLVLMGAGDIDEISGVVETVLSRR